MFELWKCLRFVLFFSSIVDVLGTCSPDCTSCTNDTCVACELGTYLESGSCHLCPEHCSSCYNSEICNNCTDGYFGLSCPYECSSFCANSTCYKDNGLCTGGCIDGYFQSGSSCYQCSPNCKTCATSSFNCVQCRDGYFGASCEYPCSRCKDGICSKENCTYGCGDGYFQANGACNLCTIHCRSCSGSFDNCHTCDDGYFGKDCQFSCSECIPCNQEDGSCQIAVILGNCSSACTSCTNDTCVTCELGTYLESGSCHMCPEHCTSCYNFEACSSCTEGYFGLSCAFNCSFCINNTCNKDSGICTGGCIDGYFQSGSSCFQCSSNCKTCGISSNNCVQCKDGYYGPSCEYPCSRCKDGICSKENCTYGCGDGYFQANGACKFCSIYCRSCSDTFDNCHTCADGYFGQNCQFSCSECIPCYQEDGSCPGTMHPPTASTDLATRLIASETSVPKTRTQPSTSVSPQTNTSPELSQILTSTETKNYQDNQSVDNIIIYASAGGGGGLAFVVLVVVVVALYKKRLRIKQKNGRNNSQIRESVGASPDYTTLTTGPREQDGHLYSSLDNTNSMVILETRSTTRELSGQETHHAMHQIHMGGTGYGTYVNVN